MCSWWWAEEPPETCRASVEINKSRKKRCILLAVIWNYITMHGHVNVKYNFCTRYFLFSNLSAARGLENMLKMLTLINDWSGKVERKRLYFDMPRHAPFFITFYSAFVIFQHWRSIAAEDKTVSPNNKQSINQLLWYPVICVNTSFFFLPVDCTSAVQESVNRETSFSWRHGSRSGCSLSVRLFIRRPSRIFCFQKE